MLESRVRPKEMEPVAALNPEKKECSDVAVQANYLAVVECKTGTTLCYLYKSNNSSVNTVGLKGVEISGERVF